VILGDMGELGGYAWREHVAILEFVRDAGVAAEYLVGPTFADAASHVAPTGDRHLFADTAALGEYLAANPIEDHVILVKGSRAVGLEAVVELL
jgi:UDP-N-acetylmuramoyl-tripeptide--D-alanyl-D-alanine ligase